MKKWLFLFALILGTLALDQWSKRIVLDYLPVGDSWTPIPALQAFFQITHNQNRGAAFGLFTWANDLLVVIAPIVTLVMIYLYPRIPAGMWVRRVAMGLICGGALGNAIDRVLYGHVIDFIHYQIPSIVANVSNIADHAIVFGVLLMLISTWREEEKLPTPSAPPSPE